MAPVPKNTTHTHTHANTNQPLTISSQAHPNHPLIHHSDDNQSYLCHACKASGFGDRFRCHACSLDLHIYCANCPHELSSFLHAHPLTLMVRNPQVASRNHRVCDVCRESIHGNFYRCKDCHFHVHPLCTQLPQNLRHLIDPNHKLTLHRLSSAPARCSVCKADCSSLWVYGCGVCKLNVHLECLRKPFGSDASSSTGSRGIRMHQQPLFHGGFPGGAFPQYASAWGYPNYYYFGHPGLGPVHSFAHNSPSHQPNHGGHGPASPSSSLGSLFGSSMFSLVGNLAIGALTDFIFGSIGF